MTVYVDNMRAPAGRAEITGYRGRPARWSHLLADTPPELAEFARRLQLQPTWLQHPGTHREHYDVTDTARRDALALGAQPVTYPRGMADLLAARRAVCRCVSLPDCRWGELAR